MQLIDRLTSDAIQTYTLLGNAGQQIIFTLRYLPTQEQWIFDVNYGNLNLHSSTLPVSLNALRGYRNIINFGLLVSSTDGYEPQRIDDFITGRIKIYLLNQAEVNNIEALFFT